MPKFTYDAFMALVAKEKAAAANKAVEEAAAEKAANKTAATEEAAREAAAAEEADEFRSNKRDEGKRQKTDKDGGKWVFTGRGWVGQRLKRYWDEDGTKFYLEGVVTDYVPAQGGHKLTYDADTELESYEWHDLDKPIEGEVDLSAFRVPTV